MMVIISSRNFDTTDPKLWRTLERIPFQRAIPIPLSVEGCDAMAVVSEYLMLVSNLLIASPSRIAQFIELFVEFCQNFVPFV